MSPKAVGEPHTSKRQAVDSPDSPSPRKRTLENKFLDDKLGTLVSELVATLESCSTWAEFVGKVHGRPYLAASIDEIDHPAKPLLQELRDKGVPVVVDSSKWSQEYLEQCFARGPHPSAEEHKWFLRDEMADFAGKGFWAILPYDLVKDLPDLKCSPVAVKEERDRRPRVLVDHTWFAANQDTTPVLPPEVMQFGRALQRVLHRVHHSNPAFGPVFLAKFDISDGFYRMHLVPDQAPNLAVSMPRCKGEPPLVAIPLVCTMGWVNSPPSFCAMSETVADIANQRMGRRHAPPH